MLSPVRLLLVLLPLLKTSVPPGEVSSLLLTLQRYICIYFSSLTFFQAWRTHGVQKASNVGSVVYIRAKVCEDMVDVVVVAVVAVLFLDKEKPSAVVDG